MSSARAVRCRLKCHNERNPYRWLPSIRLGTPATLPSQDERKAGMTSNQHGPYVRGYTRVTMGGTASRNAATRFESSNPLPVRIGVCNPTHSVKLDSLVIAHQPWRGEYVPGPCTHRPSSHESRGCLKSAAARRGLGQYR